MANNFELACVKLMVPQRLDKCYDGVVTFLDFHSSRHGVPLVDSWSRGLDLTQMYPDRDAFVPRSGYITARDQRMVESGVREGGQSTARLFFVNKHINVSGNIKTLGKTKLGNNRS